jgi:hypothetical protein
MKRFSSGYDDTYSESLSVYDQTLPNEPNMMDSPSIDRDHKLLSFSPTALPWGLQDYAYRQTSISLTAQLHGMFFLAESPWPADGETAAPAMELTCYRRNLFQITGDLTMPRGLRNILTDQGERIPIIGQELMVSATESVEEHPVKIISVPWKTTATSAPVVDDKTEKEPTVIPIDLSNGQDLDPDFVTFPIAWKRLQFRIATANNGRRRELQQHFVISIKVIATLNTGDRVPICEVRSGAIIVRGRSPRNFQSRKDMPISGSGQPGRKTQGTARASTGDSSHTHPKSERLNATLLDIPQIPFAYNPNDIVSPDFFEWKIPPANPSAVTVLPDISLPMPGPAMYAQSSPDLSRRYMGPSSRPIPKAPINLSLLEDEPHSNPSSALPTPNPISKHSSASPSVTPARKTMRLSQVPVRPPSFSINQISGTDESADLLYEYFPLGLDDWMPPVDAVYRPHVVRLSTINAPTSCLIISPATVLFSNSRRIGTPHKSPNRSESSRDQK